MEKLDQHDAKLLDLQSPWEVIDVDLDLEENRMSVRVEYRNGVNVLCFTIWMQLPWHRNVAGGIWKRCSLNPLP